MPVVQFDFTRPRFNVGGEMTILTGIDVTSGMTFAAQLQNKMVSNHAVQLIRNFLQKKRPDRGSDSK